MQGNLIGVDASGNASMGNNEGVRIFNGSNNTIGGAVPGARNIISGNRWSGVDITASDGVSVSGNVVQGNFIGTDVTGSDLPPRAVPHPMLVPAPVEGREGRASSGPRATA